MSKSDQLEIKKLSHSYEDGNRVTRVLKDVSANFLSGSLYTIVGESGSGKTTLISLLAGLESVQTGDILFNGDSIKKIGLRNFRLKNVNIVFQSFNLIPYMTARENVEVAVDFAGLNYLDGKTYAYELLADVGISREKADRLVMKLSGGEQQRVAIARSIAGKVPIIVADEPTGNLDEKTEEKIMGIFKKLADQGRIVIVVTHSKNVTRYADVIYEMRSGSLKIKK